MAKAATPLNPSRISKCCLVCRMSELCLALSIVKLGMMFAKSVILFRSCQLVCNFTGRIAGQPLFSYKSGKIEDGQGG